MLRVFTAVLLFSAVGCSAFGSDVPSTEPDASAPDAGTEDGGTPVPVSTSGSVACTTTTPCVAPQTCCRGVGGPQCGATSDCAGLTDAVARLACDDVTDCNGGSCCLSLGSSAAGPVLTSACQNKCLTVELCEGGGVCSFGACVKYRCALRNNSLDIWACGKLPNACTPL